MIALTPYVSVFILSTILITERSSRHIDELMATAKVPKGPVENKPGDSSILRVIEAYCASGKGASSIREYYLLHVYYVGTCML